MQQQMSLHAARLLLRSAAGAQQQHAAALLQYSNSIALPPHLQHQQQHQHQRGLSGWVRRHPTHHVSNNTVQRTPSSHTSSSSIVPINQQQLPATTQHSQQQHQQQLLPSLARWFSTTTSSRSENDAVARQRLAAAHQRRQRQQEALQHQRRQQQHQLQQQQQPTTGNSTQLQPHGAGTAVVPQESPPAEVQVEAVFNHPALIVTRAIEWGTLILGFEQATKYTVYDQDGNAVALIAEEISGIGNEIQRQLLRTRRSFTSTVLSADGSQVLFRVRRPAYLINSYMYIEDSQGEVIGEVRQSWHLWRRKYDLFIGRRQFAAIDGPLLAWEFELKDAAGNTLALIDRNFLGFAREIFTDAGKYVVHFGYAPNTAAAMAEKTLAIRSGKEDVHVTPLARLRTEVAVIPSVTGNQLVVSQPLPLDERMIALAAAISVDYNFFSPHSRTSGLLSPPIFMPVPLPGGGAVGGGAAAEGGAAAGGAGAAGAAGAEAGAVGAAAGESGAAADFGGAAGGAGGVEGFGEAADAGFSHGFGSGGAGGGFGADDADSFKWDDVAGGGGLPGGGDEESTSGLWGILVGIWAMIFGE